MIVVRNCLKYYFINNQKKNKYGLFKDEKSIWVLQVSSKVTNK